MKLPQVSLRDLLWLVLAAALVLGWWRDRETLRTSHRLTTLQIHSDWEGRRNELIRKHAREKLQLTLQLNEAKMLSRGVNSQVGANPSP